MDTIDVLFKPFKPWVKNQLDLRKLIVQNPMGEAQNKDGLGMYDYTISELDSQYIDTPWESPSMKDFGHTFKNRLNSLNNQNIYHLFLHYSIYLIH